MKRRIRWENKNFDDMGTLKGMKEEHYFNEIAPKYTHMCKEVVF